MSYIQDILLSDLRALITTLGQDGGLMSPSIYDTAQVVRFCSPMKGVGPELDWLLDQQHADGGWGDPVSPRARDLPTLAAVLAIHTVGRRRSDPQAVRRGLDFLRQQAHLWAEPLPDDIPGGVELLLPRLLESAAAVGLTLSSTPYQALIDLGHRRRQVIARLAEKQPLIGTTAAHSWEGWGTTPDPRLIDGAGSIGHSPAASAAWLRMASAQPELADECARVSDYLDRAAAATGCSIPGVVPTSWPIGRFEQAFALYTLLLAGLIDHPALHDVVQPQLDEIERAMGAAGLGFTDWFLPDGDDTAAALAALVAAGRPINFNIMQRFADGDHFCTWPLEMQASLSVTAHAVHALALGGRDSTPAIAYLASRQQPDGRWIGDKWNRSWLYTTFQVIVALQDTGHDLAIKRAVEAIVAHQNLDGGWGAYCSTAEETAYGMLALRTLEQAGMLDQSAQGALARARQWLLNEYRPFAQLEESCWLGKEPYRPRRVARMFELVATIAAAEDVLVPQPAKLDISLFRRSRVVAGVV